MRVQSSEPLHGQTVRLKMPYSTLQEILTKEKHAHSDKLFIFIRRCTQNLLCEVRIIYMAFCPLRFMERKITQIFSLTYLPDTHLLSSFIRRYFRHKRKETVFSVSNLKWPSHQTRGQILSSWLDKVDWLDSGIGLRSILAEGCHAKCV